MDRSDKMVAMTLQIYHRKVFSVYVHVQILHPFIRYNFIDTASGTQQKT